MIGMKTCCVILLTAGFLLAPAPPAQPAAYADTAPSPTAPNSFKGKYYWLIWQFGGDYEYADIKITGNGSVTGTVFGQSFSNGMYFVGPLSGTVTAAGAVSVTGSVQVTGSAVLDPAGNMVITTATSVIVWERQ